MIGVGKMRAKIEFLQYAELSLSRMLWYGGGNREM